MENCILILVWCMLLFNVNNGIAKFTSVEQDLSLTRQEMLALEKFKPRILPHLRQNFMKEDMYLIRWLRAADLNLQQAERMMRENLRYRKEFQIDTILHEDWSDMKEEYPFSIDTFDKEGRPSPIANLGTWDARKAVVTGRADRLLRYTFKLLEESAQKVIELEHQGKNVTRYRAIYNLEGFNVVQHTCPRCLVNYMEFLNRYQENYPGFAEAVVFINAPSTFQIVMNAVRPVFNAETRKIVKVIGTDKTQWMGYLDQHFSRSQLRPELGGSRED